MGRRGLAIAGVALAVSGAWLALAARDRGADLAATIAGDSAARDAAPPAALPLAPPIEPAHTRPVEPPRQPGQRFVRVVDGATGAPVPGARLVVRWGDGDRIHWDEDGSCGEPLDAHGRYAIGSGWAGAAFLAVVPGARCSAWVPWVRGDADIECALELGGEITGVVRLEGTGTSVPYAEVCLADRADGELTEGPRTRTDEIGRYRFAGLPPGVEFVPFLKDPVRFHGPHVALGFGQGPGADDDAGAQAPAPVSARFDSPSGSRTLDIEAQQAPGVLVCFQLRVPARRDPASLRYVHTVSVEDEAGSSLGGFSGGDCEPLDGGFQAIVFLPEGRNELQFVGQGLFTALPPRDVRGHHPMERQEVSLDAVRPLVLQLVDEHGTPQERGGVAIEHCLQRRPFGFGQPAGFRNVATTAGDGTVALGADLDSFQPGDGPMPETLHLRAVAGDLFPGDDRVGPWAASFDLRALWREVLQPGDRPLVLAVPARAWVPLRLRVIGADKAPVAGVTLRGTPPDAFDGDAAVTDDTGYATLRLRDLPGRAFGPVAPSDPASRPAPCVTIESERWAGSRAASMVLDGIAMWWDQLHDLGPDGEGPVFQHVGVPLMSPRELERGAVALLATPVRDRTVRLVERDGHPMRAQVVTVWCGDAFNGWAQRVRIQDDGRVRLQVPARAAAWLQVRRRPFSLGSWVRLDGGSDGEDVITGDRTQSFIVMHEDGRALEPSERGRVVASGLDLDGAPVPVTLTRWDQHRLTVIVPGATRRVRLQYGDAPLVVTLPDGHPIDPPPEWRVP